MNKFKRYLPNLLKYIFLFYFGGSLYLTIEVFYRGYSHQSMFVAGAIAFVIVGGLNNWFEWEWSILFQMLIGGIAITVIELIFGLILNVQLGLDIWDYSDKIGNFGGQICIEYSVKWFMLSAVGIVIDDIIRWKFFKEDKPRYRFI